MTTDKMLQGVDGTHWSLVDDILRNAWSIVDWTGEHSDHFEVNQGVRQGAYSALTCIKFTSTQP